MNCRGCPVRKNVNAKIAARARRLLKLAEDRAKKVANWIELHNALFGIDGLATRTFATEAERTAFCRTPEYKRLLAMMDDLPAPRAKEFRELISTANGA